MEANWKLNSTASRSRYDVEKIVKQWMLVFPFADVQSYIEREVSLIVTRKQESIAASQMTKLVKVLFICILPHLKSRMVEMFPSRPKTVQHRIPQPHNRYSYRESLEVMMEEELVFSIHSAAYVCQLYSLVF